MIDGAPLRPEPNPVEAFDSTRDDAIALNLLTADGSSVEEAQTRIAALRADPSVTISGIVMDDEPVAVIAMRKATMSNELDLLA